LYRTRLFVGFLLFASIFATGRRAEGPIASARTTATGVGFQQVMAPDIDGKAFELGIWYPSKAPGSPQPLGLFEQTVATDAPISGDRLPLIMISHGAAGSLASHYDSALALARAGFIVAAVTHAGDNWRDQSLAATRRGLINRPREISRAIDYMLLTWPGRLRIDSGRIGIFGSSLGGFTALTAVGGAPELRRIPQLCAERAEAPECRFIRERHGDQLDAIPASDPDWTHVRRIKAAVIVAPAIGFTFGGGGLCRVKAPVQLWLAEKDQEAPNEWNSDIVRKALPVPPDVHKVRGAGHFAFLAPCSEALAKAAPRICSDAPGFDRSTFHEKFNRSVVLFFRKNLTGSVAKIQ